MVYGLARPQQTLIQVFWGEDGASFCNKSPQAILTCSVDRDP